MCSFLDTGLDIVEEMINGNDSVTAKWRQKVYSSARDASQAVYSTPCGFDIGTFDTSVLSTNYKGVIP